MSVEKMVPVAKIPFFHPLSRRFHVIFMLMLGCFCMAYTRSNLGMVLTCLVNSTAVALEQKTADSTVGEAPQAVALKLEALRCAAAQNAHTNRSAGEIPINNYGGEIVWNARIQNLVFTGTFFGSLLSTLPAGYLADRTSPVNLLTIGCLILAATSIVFPYLTVHWGWEAVFISRFIMGLGEGLFFPSVNAIIGRWIPNHEKAQAASLFTVGAQLSGALGIPLSTAFCLSSLRWPGIFYFSFLFIIGWGIAFRMTTSNSPAKAKCMSKRERIYLEQNIENHRAGNEKHEVPWKKILTSRPVIACLVVSYCFNCLMTLIHGYQPTFFKEVVYLKMSDASNGIFSALPHIGQMISKMSWSIGIDHLKVKGIISHTTGCRLSQTIAGVSASLLLVLIAVFGSDCTKPTVSLVLFILLGACLGPGTSGFYTSMITLAPRYVGTISSINMIVGFCGMISTPFFVSFFRVYGTSDEWRNIFYLIAFLVLFSTVVFGCFASGEVQSWGRRTPSEKAALSLGDDQHPPLLECEEKTLGSLLELAA
ncbi:putative transporter slc-17.3 [Aphelenchoides fujianensis]|nr:putative transporter slc-17.3 [Aphelenchoides fujianensis]